MHRLVFLLLLSPLALSQKQSPQKIPQPSASSTPTTDFTCPEDFGYFPHPSDCTQYYVCVFGGALLESCTGGLMYSHDLQTCDWPRNVYCYNGTTYVDNNIENSNQEQRTRTRGSSSASRGSSSSASQGANPSSYSYTPIKIETYGQLRNAAEESVIGKKQRGRIQVDDEYQQQRSGRSYEGSLPNYKEEIYQGRTTIPPDIPDKTSCTSPPPPPPTPPSTNSTITTTSTTIPTTSARPQRHRRSLADFHHRRFNIFKKRRPPPPPPNSKPPRRRRGRARSRPRDEYLSQRMDIRDPETLRKYKLPIRAGFKSKPVLSHPSYLTHRVSSPGTVLYPPSFFNTPTYGFVNVDKPQHQQHGHNNENPKLRPNPITSTTQPPRIVKITTSKPGDNLHDSSYYSSQLRLGGGGISIPNGAVLGEYFNPGGQFNHHHHPQLVKHHFSNTPSHPHHPQHQHHQHPHHIIALQGPPGPGPAPPATRWNLLTSLPGHPGYFINNNNNNKPPTNVHEDVTSHDKELSEFVTNAYVNRLKGTLDNTNHLVSELPKKPPTPSSQVPFVRHNLGSGGVGHAQQHQLLQGSVSSTPTRSKYTGTNKYYDNSAQLQQPQQPQQEDDYYVNQRYAANVGNNTGAYYYPGSTQEDDDASYYVYDDEEDDQQQQKYNQGQQVSRPQTAQDFDYKYQPQQPYTPRAPTQQILPQTRRPYVPAPSPPSPPTTTSTRTRSRTRTSSSGSSSGSTRSRPTLKPKSSIVKAQSAPVRDVYLDPPSRPENIYETPVPNTPATKCRKDLCVLPDCSCGGKDIPGGLRPEETPQIVLLTFDDSVNDLNKNLYRDLFEKGRKNPNGCPISATFYISHEWTDYSQVQNLAADGHEIASHSVSHSFGEQYSQKKWDREINGQREILAAYGGVKMSEIRGMRAPFLAIGGNNMFKMLHDSNFTYDSSMPIYENRPPSWPYTLDYRIFHDCMIPPCPTKSYPGVWEVPMVMWQDLKGGRCSMGDACSNPPTAEGVYQMLAKNFERHYTTNRAPFGLYYHAAWFTQPHHKEGFEAFLDTLVQMDDVWLVTNWQALQWIRNPTPINRIHNFGPWSCHNTNDRPPRCNHPKVCNLWHKSGVRYMKTCQQCPQQYPWTGNTGVPYSNSL